MCKVSPFCKMAFEAALSGIFSAFIFAAQRFVRIEVGMSAFGPKRTSLVAPHMSAFGG
jgi:hypothetical protein